MSSSVESVQELHHSYHQCNSTTMTSKRGQQISPTMTTNIRLDMKANLYHLQNATKLVKDKCQVFPCSSSWESTWSSF